MTCFVYFALAENHWKIKLGEFTIDQVNMGIVGENLLSAFCKLFLLRFVGSDDQWKGTV